MRIHVYSFLTIAIAALCPGTAFAAKDHPADLDDEDATQEYAPAPGSEWKEDTINLPPYPSQDELIDIRLEFLKSPFKVLIDPHSLSVGKDQVVRYTVVQRSPSGVENVSYEGIRCIQRMVQRYAYGSGGKFHPARNPDWRYVRKSRQDDYLTSLMDYFFCPLPGGDAQRLILKRLERSASSPTFYKHELEE